MLTFIAIGVFLIVGLLCAVVYQLGRIAASNETRLWSRPNKIG